MRKQLHIALEEGGDRSDQIIDPRHNDPESHLSSVTGAIGSVLGATAGALGMPPTLALSELVGEDCAREAADDMEQGASESDTVGAVLESLGLYALEQQRLVTAGSCTAMTNSLIMMGAQQQLNRLGLTLPSVSLEADADANAQGQLVLEGLQDGWNRVKQSFLISVQDNYESWDDLDVLEKALGTNFGRIDAIQREFKQKKFTETEHTGSMVEIWKFFSDRKGQRHDLVAAAKEDVKLSEYAFGSLLDALTAQVVGLASALSGAKMTTPAEAAALAAKVEKLKHPLELWDMKYVNKERGYLNGVGLEVKEGSARNVLTVDGKQLPRLAKLATPGYVNESSSVGHTMREIFVGGGPVGGAVHVVTADSIKYATKDIPALLAAGRAYGEALKPVLKAIDKEEAAHKKLKAALEHLHVDARQAPECALVLAQIQQYYSNLMKAGFTVVWRERMRALQGMRFCAYAAERMIANAK